MLPSPHPISAGPGLAVVAGPWSFRHGPMMAATTAASRWARIVVLASS